MTIIAPHLCITPGVQGDPVVPANYGDQLPITRVLGQIDLRSLIKWAYNRIPFNEEGLNWIIKGGITKLCLRTQADLEESYGPVGANWCQYRSEQGGRWVAPTLIVCYEPP